MDGGTGFELKGLQFKRILRKRNARSLDLNVCEGAVLKSPWDSVDGGWAGASPENYLANRFGWEIKENHGVAECIGPVARASPREHAQHTDFLFVRPLKRLGAEQGIANVAVWSQGLPMAVVDDWPRVRVSPFRSRQVKEVVPFVKANHESLVLITIVRPHLEVVRALRK